MIEGLLTYVSLEEHWIGMLIEFMREELGFLAANRVSDAWIRPNGAIRQGESLSPAICVMNTKPYPMPTVLWYADGTLLWIPGNNLEEIGRQSRELKSVMGQYAEYSRQQMNLGKSRIVLQGVRGEYPQKIEGVEVARG